MVDSPALLAESHRTQAGWKYVSCSSGMNGPAWCLVSWLRLVRSANRGIGWGVDLCMNTGILPMIMVESLKSHRVSMRGTIKTINFVPCLSRTTQPVISLGFSHRTNLVTWYGDPVVGSTWVCLTSAMPFLILSVQLHSHAKCSASIASQWRSSQRSWMLSRTCCMDSQHVLIGAGKGLRASNASVREAVSATSTSTI